MTKDLRAGLVIRARPYGQTPVVVLSHNSISFPYSLPDTVSHSAESPRNLLERLSNVGIEHVYVDGGLTIRGFISDGLVDEITVTVIPIVLGDGIRLFIPMKNDINLAHVRTTVYDFGFVQTTYSILKNV